MSITSKSLNLEHPQINLKSLPEPVNEAAQRQNATVAVIFATLQKDRASIRFHAVLAGAVADRPCLLNLCNTTDRLSLLPSPTYLLGALQHYESAKTTVITDPCLGALRLTVTHQRQVQYLCTEPANGEHHQRQIVLKQSQKL